MEGLTASEIAGFGVGALLLCATIAAPRVDGFIASSQRRSLSMCKRCGDLRMVACSQCKGVGSVRKGGFFTFGMLDNIYESLGAESKVLVNYARSSKEAEEVSKEITATYQWNTIAFKYEYFKTQVISLELPFKLGSTILLLVIWLIIQLSRSSCSFSSKQ